jgi:ferredoxin
LSEIYRKLQQHLDKMPVGFPRAESGSDIRVLKHLFTPEEAKIATFLRFGWNRDLESLDKIYDRIKNTGISLEELETKLDNMVKKGAILTRKDDNQKYYANAMLIIGMYEFQVDKFTKGFLKDFNDYLNEIWGREANKTGYHQLRTIPVEKSLDPSLNVAPYDNIREIIEKSEGPFVKINCVCRQEMDIYGKPCKITNHKENCLGFGDMVQTYIDQGWGTQISKEETLKILKKNQEEGLILRPNNSQDVEFVCSCCSCCDRGISGLLRVPDPVNYVISNFYSEVDPELCTGCGSCIDRCQLKAITLVEDISSVDHKRCIGCGNCVTVCPSEAMTLIKKDKECVPPKTMDDLYDLILDEKVKPN